jgi:hypothetical protein
MCCRNYVVNSSSDECCWRLLLLLLQAVTAARERLEWRLAVLTGNLEQLLQHVFGLLGRLSEVRMSQMCYTYVITHLKSL